MYWLNCQPCHGDRGQGLTDEWRAQYPPEDQNCWQAGCHGERPYPDGFTLPRAVPALIGANTLTRFATAAELQAFISRAMPFNKPGSLPQEETWAITAFLLRAHGLPDSRLPVTEEAAARSILLDQGTVAPAAPALSLPAAFGLAAGSVVLTLLGVRLWRRRRAHV